MDYHDSLHEQLNDPIWKSRNLWQIHLHDALQSWFNLFSLSGHWAWVVIRAQTVGKTGSFYPLQNDCSVVEPRKREQPQKFPFLKEEKHILGNFGSPNPSCVGASGTFIPCVFIHREMNCYTLGKAGVNSNCCRMPQVCALFIRALNLKAQESSAAVLQGLCYKVLH